MLPRQGKAKGIHHYQAVITLNVKDLFKKKKIKTINIKWQQIHNYQQLNLKNKLSNKSRDRIMDMEGVLMVARWDGGVGEWVKR